MQKQERRLKNTVRVRFSKRRLVIVRLTAMLLFLLAQSADYVRKLTNKFRSFNQRLMQEKASYEFRLL